LAALARVFTTDSTLFGKNVGVVAAKRSGSGVRVTKVAGASSAAAAAAAAAFLAPGPFALGALGSPGIATPKPPPPRSFAFAAESTATQLSTANEHPTLTAPQDRERTPLRDVLAYVSSGATARTTARNSTRLGGVAADGR
jgi:hypothetical protein